MARLAVVEVSDDERLPDLATLKIQVGGKGEGGGEGGRPKGRRWQGREPLGSLTSEGLNVKRGVARGGNSKAAAVDGVGVIEISSSEEEGEGNESDASDSPLDGGEDSFVSATERLSLPTSQSPASPRSIKKSMARDLMPKFDLPIMPAKRLVRERFPRVGEEMVWEDGGGESEEGWDYDSDHLSDFVVDDSEEEEEGEEEKEDEEGEEGEEDGIEADEEEMPLPAMTPRRRLMRGRRPSRVVLSSDGPEEGDKSSDMSDVGSDYQRCSDNSVPTRTAKLSSAGGLEKMLSEWDV